MSDQTLLFSSNEPFSKVGAELVPSATSLVSILLVEVTGLFIHIQPLASPKKDFYITISSKNALVFLFYVSMNGTDATLKANLW